MDNHYWRIFGSAVLMSLISGGAAYAMDMNDSGAASLSTSSSAPSMQDAMTSALASQLGQTTTKLLEKNLNVHRACGPRWKSAPVIASTSSSPRTSCSRRRAKESQCGESR